MEDDNGLELSLGLSVGGSCGKSKARDVSSETKVEEGNNTNMISGQVTVSDSSFKNFIQTGIENQDIKGKQKSEQVLHQHENFWTELGKCSASMTDRSNDLHKSLSQFTRYQEMWNPNNKSIGPEEEKSASNKRKLPFEDIKFQNKQERVVDCADTHGKSSGGVNLVRNSHVSATTEDGSSGENEDAAESEAEGSNSWLVSQREDNPKSSDIPKFSDKHVLSDSSGIGSQGQKEPSSGNVSNPELKVAYGIPLSLQPLTVMTVPYPVPVKLPNATTAPNTTGFPSPCVMQLMPVANNERPIGHSINASNLQLAFGYSSVQLPTLETGSSWAFNSQPRHVTPLISRDHAAGAPNSDHFEDGTKTSQVSVQAPHNTSPMFAYEGKPMNLVKGSSERVAEAGSSSQTEDEGKGQNAHFRPKETANQPIAGGFSVEGSMIRPGVASNMKFGGCGSYPNLPWVSTTGPGPNGRTISGVTYKYNQNEIKIVCACHGTHMSPEDFIQHASESAPDTENNASLPSFPTSNKATSARS